MVASETFAEFLREQLAPLGRVTLRRMFGKSGVFCDGVMFAMVTENTLYVRVDEENRATFSAAEAFPPAQLREAGLRHRPLLLARAGAAVRRTDEFVAWAQAALAAARTCFRGRRRVG